MDKPRIFLGSSGKQAKLLQALTRGLEDVAHVEPWTTSFNPGTTTLDRLVELAHEVDFAAFVFARDDWTTTSPAASPTAGSRSGFSARQCRLRSRPVRWRPWHAPDLHPPCTRREASERSPRPHVCSVRRRDDPCRDESRQPEASEGDRERGARRPHRGPVVAVLADGARPAGAFRREPSADLARPRRRAGGARPLLAGGWQPVGEVLVRSGRRRGRSLRASSTIGRENGLGIRTRRSWTGRGRSGWSPPIARRGTSRLVRTRSPSVNARTAGVYWRAEPEDMSILDGQRRSATRGVDRRAAEALEVDHERLRSTQGGAPPTILRVPAQVWLRRRCVSRGHRQSHCVATPDGQAQSRRKRNARYPAATTSYARQNAGHHTGTPGLAIS